MKKVRYLTVCRSSIEVVSKLTEHEKALFIDILYSAFKQIEAGEPVTVPEVDGVLSVILDDAISELESGFATYMKRVSGDQDEINLQAYQLNQWLQKLGITVDAEILKAWKEYGFDAIRSAVHRFDNAKPPVNKSAFLDIVREEGNRR